MTSFTRTRLALSGVVLAFGLGLQAAPAHATVVSGTSTGWALFADLDLLFLPLLNQSEVPFLTNSAPAPYNNDAQVSNFENPNPCGSGLQPACVASATLLYSHVESNVNGGAGNKSASATGGVEDFDLLGSILGGLLSNVTLESISTVSGDFGSLTPTGTTTIAAITLLGTSAVNLNNIPANTDLFAFLGVGALTGISAIANEQSVTCNAGSCMQVTNALHLIFAGGVIGGTVVNGDLILGHSEAKLTAVPVPAAVYLFASGLVGLAAVARRKAVRA